jgi:hypothetical protein
MPAEQVSIIIRAKDFASRVFSRVAGGLKRVGISAAGLRRAFLTVIASAGGLVFVFKKIFDAGAGVLETQSKFNTVFGESAERMEAFNKEFARTAGLTETTGQALLATTGSIVQGLGFSTEASAEFSEAVLRLAGDLGSFNNIPTAETARAIQAALTGEREMLKRLGIVLLDVDVKTRALALSGKTSAAALTNQEKATASLQLITERAGKAVGDLNRTQNSAENTAKRVKAAFGDQFNQLSTDLIPVLEQLLPLFEELAGKAEAATARVAGFITTLFDLAGLTNATLRKELAGFAKLPEGELQSRADRLRTEIAGKRARVAEIAEIRANPPTIDPELRFRARTEAFNRRAEFLRGLAEEARTLPAEIDNLQIGLGFLETRISRLKDTSEGTADSVERVVNALRGGPGPVDVARGVVDTTGGAGRTTVGGIRLGSAKGFEAMRLKGLQEANRLRVLENRARDASSEVETLAETVEDSFGNMAIAAVSGSAQMEQAVTSAFQRILQSVGGGGLLGGLLGGFGGFLLGKILGGGRKETPRPIPVSIAKVEPSAVQDLQTGPSKIVMQLIQDGVTIEEIEYELRRRQNTDQYVRIPNRLRFP